MNSSITQKCKLARQMSSKLANLGNEEKNQLLYKIADQIKGHKQEIADANALDVQAATELMARGELSQALLDRLILNDSKINQLVTYLHEVAKLDDPVGCTQYAMQLDKGLDLTRISCPIGVLAVLFESRPEVVIQVSALSLKSGNPVILKGGSEAAHTNRALYSIIADVLSHDNLDAAVSLIETRQDVAEILKEEKYIDLIIPRGSNAFVRYIQDNSSIPVLGHSEGICNIYIDSDADPKMAAEISVDSKTNYPAACNAVENLLFDQACTPSLIESVLLSLVAAGVQIKACPRLLDLLPSVTMEAATAEDFSTEYSGLVISTKMVDGLNEAIEFINQNGSHHTDSIITNDMHNAEVFFAEVDSACVFHNSSTRFSDGYVFGLGAEVGVSTNKTHARGPVGLEGLVIYKYVLKGKGQTKASYTGPSAKPFIHMPLPY